MPTAFGLESFCFPGSTSLDKVSSHVSAILAPRDKVFKRESLNCLELEISPSRKELVEKWIRKKYKVMNTYSEGVSNKTQSMVTQNCRLKVDRISKGTSQTNNTRIGSRNSLSQTNTRSSGKRTSQLLLGLGQNGSMRVNDEIVFLSCRGVNGGGYVIGVSIDSESSGLTTTLQVTKGSKVNLGQVVNSLNSRSNTVGIPRGIDKSKRKSNESFDYYLIAD